MLFDAFLMLSEGQDEELAALPDTGDLAADLKFVLRATVAELRDPRYDVPMRALTTEVMHDEGLAADYEERLAKPISELKKARLRSAQAAGELPADLDLDVAVEMIFGPPLNRWLLRSGPLTGDYADSIVDTALAGLRVR